jgi:hypothetical protein
VPVCVDKPLVTDEPTLTVPVGCATIDELDVVYGAELVPPLV